MERKGDSIDISFLHVTPNTIRAELKQVEVTSSDISPPTPSDKPTFGPRPDTQATNFNFETEVQHLPFTLNMEKEAKLTHVQQSQFIDLIYDHLEVFSLHDEDLGFCKWIKQTITTTLDRPVYLLDHTIPPQLQGKCTSVWTAGCDKAFLGHHKVLMHPRC